MVPIVVMILITLSMVGVGFSSVTSDVINSGNFVTFTKIGGQVTPDDNTNTGDITNVVETTTITTDGDGNPISLPTYEITPQENLGGGKPVTFQFEGKFCIHLDITKNTSIKIGNNPVYTTSVAGYYIISGNTLVKKTLSEIIDGDLWSETSQTITFTFRGSDGYIGKTPLEFIFKS